jgi:hypothetical protein
MMIRRLSRFFAFVAGAGVAAAIGYIFVGRPWHLRWGATDAEAAGAFPGDELVPHSKLQSTRAITIHAGPETVWKWLVQIGYKRAGWYSYDQLEAAAGAGDFAEGGSARRILPEFQELAVGDFIPLAPETNYTVVEMQPDRLLALRSRIDVVTGRTMDFSDPDFGDSFDNSWVFRLTPTADGGSTRLAVRFRVDFAPTPKNRVFAYGALEPAVFVMEQKMLRGIRERAEEPNPRPLP